MSEGETIIKSCVACVNANGEPDIYFCMVERQDNDSDLYTIAEFAAFEEGYEAPFVVWNETDRLFTNLDCANKFVWESASIWG